MTMIPPSPLDSAFSLFSTTPTEFPTENAKLTIRIPNFLANWPFEPAFNPHFGLPTDASAEWVLTYVSSAKSKASFKAIKVGLLAAMAYPHMEPAHLRTACDAMSLLFLMDDVTDLQTEAEVRQVKPPVMDALRHPDKELDTIAPIAAEIHKSFWSLATATASKCSAERFIASYQDFFDAIEQQASDREHGITRNMEDYTALRRATSAVLPSLDLLLLPITNIPDEILDHPVITELRNLSTDLVWLSNDVYSYNGEQARGDDTHNMITVIIEEKKLSLQAAIDEVGVIYHEKKDNFLKLLNQLPTCEGEEQTKSLAMYVWGMANWATANVLWSFESERYFGKMGFWVKETRLVELLPSTV